LKSWVECHILESSEVNENIVVTCERPKMNIVDNNDLPSNGAE